MEYYVWTKDDEDSSYAWIDEVPEDIRENAYLLNKGVSVKDWFPENVEFVLSPDYGLKLTDSIPNVIWMLIISEKLKEVIEKESGANVEFFSIILLDSKNKKIEENYYVMNLLDSVSCVSKSQSDFRMDTIIKDQIHRIRRLVLEKNNIPENAKIFRLAEKLNTIIVREDLGMKILNSKCDGMIFQDLDDFGSEFRA